MNQLHLFKRSAKILWEIGKQTYLLTFLQKFATVSSQFISIIYMTKILNALTQQNGDQILSFTIQYLIVFGGLQLIAGILEPIVSQEQEILDLEIRDLPYEKMTRVQYHYADDPKTSERLNQLDIASLNSQSSLNIQNMRMPDIFEYFIQTVWALVLLMPLFTSSESTYNGPWSWLDSPWIIVLAFGILILISVGQISSSNVLQEVVSELSLELNEANLIYNYEFNLLHDTESGKEVRLYHLQEKLSENLFYWFEQVKVFFRKIYVSSFKYQGLIIILSQGLTYLIYALLGLRVALGLLPVAVIVQLSGALGQLLSSFPQLIQTIILVLSQPEFLKEYFDFMDIPEEKEVGSIPVEKRLDHQYHLAVKDLNFAYPNTDQLILEDINLDLDVGKRYAIVGENGSGKTTFIKLLMRLYSPTSGEILLNKINAQKYKLTEYFELFSVVFQDYRLLSMTLGQNIAVGQDYDEELALETLKELGLDELLERLPEGLETYIGKEFDNRGVKLSGGQTQKVAMARAIYRNAPVMILDEPTAALDPLTEFEIYQKFDDIVGEKTAFYISHRLSSSRFSDEILVFDEGRIIQRGSHDDLVSVPGKYRDLWQAQAQYYQ